MKITNHTYFGVFFFHLKYIEDFSGILTHASLKYLDYLIRN